MRGQKQSSLDKEHGLTNDMEKDVSQKGAAAHTYDYFRDKWDKFDVVKIFFTFFGSCIIWLQLSWIFQCVKVS